MSDSLSSVWRHLVKFPMLRFSKGLLLSQFHPISTMESIVIRQNTGYDVIWPSAKTYPHSRGQQNVVLIQRWSLYAGTIVWKVYSWGPVKCVLYKQGVFIYRWSLEQVWLWPQIHCHYPESNAMLVSCGKGQTECYVPWASCYFH